MALPAVGINQVEWASKHSQEDQQRAKAGASNPKDDVQKVQQGLNKVLGTKLVVDGLWGPATQAAYDKFRRDKLKWSGDDAKGSAGPSSITKLGDMSKVFRAVADNLTPSLPSTPKVTGSNYQTQPEPAQNHTKVVWGGRTVNKRTAVLLDRAVQIYGKSFSLTQGSYNRGVAASAGTHDGGGCVDVTVSGLSSSQMYALQLALRKAGFAAWVRTPAQGFSYHIHAVDVGNNDTASLARSQVQSYFNGRDGLAGNRADNTEHRWPNWADKYNR